MSILHPGLLFAYIRRHPVDWLIRGRLHRHLLADLEILYSTIRSYQYEATTNSAILPIWQQCEKQFGDGLGELKYAFYIMRTSKLEQAIKDASSSVTSMKSLSKKKRQPT